MTRSRTAVDYCVSTVGMIALGFIVPLIVSEAGNRGELASLIIQWILILYPAWGLSYFMGSGASRPRPMLFAVSLFLYAWVGVAGLAQLRTGNSPWPFVAPQSSTLTAQLIILASYIVFALVSAVYQSHPRGEGRTFRERKQPVLRRVARGRLVLLTVAVVISAPFAINALGGVGALLSSREALALALSRFDSSLLGVVTAITTIPVFIVWLVRWRRDGLRNIPFPNHILLALLLAANLIINSPVSQPRFWIGTILIAVLLSSPRVRSAAYIRALTIAAVISAVILFPYAAYFRYEEGFTPSTSGVIDTLTTSGDYDAFKMIAATATVTEQSGHTLGNQLLGALLFWLPRSAWPDKATNTGELIAREHGFGFTNLSAPLWAEAWIDFGWLGVIVASALVAYAILRLDDLFARALAAPGFAIAQVAVPILAGYSFILLRGSLLSAMFRLIAILAVLWFISTKKPEPVKSAPRRPSHPSRTPAPRT